MVRILLPKSACQQARSSTVPPLLTCCCHPHVLVHAVPIPPYPEIVPSLLISPFNWMPVSSGMTVTTTHSVLCVRRLLRIILQGQERQDQEKKKRGTGKSFQNRNDMVIFITEERSLWAKEASGGQEEPERSGRRLLQCPGKKRQQQ